MTAGQFEFQGVEGPPNWTVFVLASTDPSLPRSDWSMISTNTFDDEGVFCFTNSIAPGSQMFYELSLAAPNPVLALPHTIALFKTSNVRDLGSSEPYLHTGRMNTLEDVIDFYERFSALARAGAVRNADPELGRVFLDDSSVAPLAAFLRALNEDYVDIPCPCQ